MGREGQKYFIQTEIMQEMKTDSKWAKQVCNTRSSKKWKTLMKNIPAELRTVFKHARIPKHLKKDVWGHIHITHKLGKTGLVPGKKETKYSTRSIRHDNRSHSSITQGTQRNDSTTTKYTFPGRFKI